MRRFAVFLATCGYIGYAPVAPGTFGSAAGLAIFALVRGSNSMLVELATIVVLFAVGVWSGTEAEHHFGGVDPGPIVLDEVVGMLITLAFIPVDITAALIGFVLFRIFDVIKPFPARRLEALHGGLGVMADDAMAAIYANITLRIVLYVGPSWL